jgi:serine/threonine protein kinase
MPGSDDPVLPRSAEQPDEPASVPGEPRVVAGYRLLRRVGEGGMSTVYLSYDIPARRPVAVKLLADHLAGQQEFVSRFYREARFSRLLQHPHIVRGYAAGYDPEVSKHYLVLEFIDGPSAHAALTRLGRLPVGVAVRIGIDIARALDFLHRKNYIHRDVKPDNILLHPEGVAKLADLGLAKRLNEDSQLTSVNQGVGTSYYMPYEQAMNAALVDGRSDIFALGATLYHLVTGEVPFRGSSHEEIIREKAQDAFQPARCVNPEVPPELDEILSATLARDPRSRFQDAAELAAALEATGLATRIPSFAPAGAAGLPADAGGHTPDAPTRADLPAGGGGLAPPARPDGPPVHPPGTAAGVEGPPTPPPGTLRLAPFVLSIALVGLGVCGLFASPTGKPAPGPRGCETAGCERPAGPTGGLPPCDHQ